MPLTVTALASGSSGNALLVQCDGGALLIDCGVALRTLERQLRCRGVEPAALTAVLLTHEHGDHALSAAALARRHRVPVICNGPTRAAMADELAGLPVEELPVGPRAAVGPFEVTSFLVPHDAAAPVGLLVRACGAALGVAVDLGSWDGAVLAGLADADLLVVEANHDRELLMAAPYPWPIRQRIFGPRGHLDNVQAGELIARVCAERPNRDVWLAHLSEQTNAPATALAGVRRVLAHAGVRGPRLAALPRRTPPSPQGAPVWCSEERLMVQGSLF